MTTTAKLRELRAAAHAARDQYGENSPEHQAAHGVYVAAAAASVPNMIKSSYVEATANET